MTHEISKADHDMAERMCGVCLTKIKKYEEEMNEGDRIAHEYEIKTLETYKTRLQTFCLLKNEDYIR
jgi:hypothetical protein